MAYTIIALVASVGAATIGGVFFAFSTFVMKALAQLPANQGIAAMQRINIVVLNPLFLGVFMGTAVVSALCVAIAIYPWSAPRSALLIIAGVLYLLGSFVVTAAFNVPRNKQLARLEADAPQTAEHWSVYVREWSRWNHIRTVASLASAACSALAIGG